MPYDFQYGPGSALTYQWDTNTLDWIKGTQPGPVGAGPDGAILDGVSAAIKATVKDYVNSNPLAVITVDTNGDPVSASGGGLTDAELRATPVPVSGTFYQATQPVSAVTLPLPTNAATSALQTQPGVDIGDVTVNNAAGVAAVNVQDGGNSITIDAANLDVALSTRLKPADTLAGVTTVGTVTTITNVVHVDDNAGSLTIDAANLDVALSTRLKPADTLTGVTTVGTITNVVHVDDDAASLTVDATSWPLPTNAATSALQTQPGVDIGDVTVNNAGGGSAVNIQDGGNSITVDATALPLPTGAATEATQLLQATEVTLAAFKAGMLLAQNTSGASATGPMVQGLVADAVVYPLDGNVSPLSLTNDGRLRVASVEARTEVDFFAQSERHMWGIEDTETYWGGFRPSFVQTGNPFTEW